MNKRDNEAGETGFGAYLFEGRDRMGLSVDEAAVKLFIPAKTLENLEDENHSELLESVFVAGFVKSYADFLGLHVEKALLLYKESHRKWHEREEEIRRRARRKKYVKAWIGGGLATFLLILLFTVSGLGLIHFFVLDKRTSAKEEPHSEEVFTAKRTATQRKLHLEVLFSEPSWFKIMVDGDRPQFYTMGAGERLEFDAQKTYNIMIGNATGVRLSLDGKHVSVVGSGGQAVALFLP